MSDVGIRLADVEVIVRSKGSDIAVVAIFWETGFTVRAVVGISDPDQLPSVLAALEFAGGSLADADWKRVDFSPGGSDDEELGGVPPFSSEGGSSQNGVGGTQSIDEYPF